MTPLKSANAHTPSQHGEDNATRTLLASAHESTNNDPASNRKNHLRDQASPDPYIQGSKGKH
jgi:hypothetical protein